MDTKDFIVAYVEKELFRYYGDGTKSGGCHVESLFTCIEMALYAVPDLMNEIIPTQNKLKLERALVSLGRMDLKDCRYWDHIANKLKSPTIEVK
jgi:hypothetical protein